MKPPFIKTHVDIGHFGNFKTPAMAKFFFEVKSEEDVKKIHKVYEFAREENINILIL
jgi:UDP-N-acetylenolpyruvoylglucosamine reductase